MFSGLMPAMVTPFDERGEVDLKATEAVVERFIEARVDGISPLGSTGEFSHLTADERKRFAEEVVRMVGGRVPVVVGVGATGTKEMVELARHAESAGADAVLVVSPFYWKIGEEALFRHFAAVAEAVGIPVVIYNLPMLTGIDLSPSLISRIATACSNVASLKDTVISFPSYYAA
jgi:2-dehydro-3-deoxy-D-pentonate aldolase